MKLVSFSCPSCGAHLDVEERRATCPYCGMSFALEDEVQAVRMEGAAQAGYEFEMGRIRAQQEVASQTARSQTHEAPEHKKAPLWLWVLGWICIFPLPITILLRRKLDLSAKFKYALIALAWVLYLGFLGSGSRSHTG